MAWIVILMTVFLLHKADILPLFSFYFISITIDFLLLTFHHDFLSF